MQQLESPGRNLAAKKHVSARRTRSCRPQCQALESRHLLSVTLSGNEPAAPLVGAPIVWTATAGGHGATPVYQFSAGPVGAPLQVVRDFSQSGSFTWNPLQEGNYQISVTVKDGFAATTGETTSTTYTVSSRVSGSAAVISPTSNPLVALYSAPASSGSLMYVQFKLLGSKAGWQATAAQPIVPGKSTNFLVANMLPNRIYVMRHVIIGGGISAPTDFQTGPLPKSLKFPSFNVQKAPNSQSALSQNVVFHVGINAPNGTVDTLATDRTGHITWYFDPVANAFPSYAPSLVTGGSVLLLGGVQNGVGGVDTLREIDLAGDTLHETNINAVNAELAALGLHSITDFNHEAQRLPNGDTAVLATTPRIVDLNGVPTLYNGDMVIVLDQNFQVAWVWDPFTSLDTNRLPTLGEGPTDWLHANSIAWSPTDGDLLVSMRSQDWVVKIDYANGAGDGHVIWRLGAGGDFTIKSSNASPWFSHQHDVRYVNGNTITLFDDGNVRRSKNPKAHSRGQELVLDEAAKTATLVVNADLGGYALALGSAQALPNGNLDFGSGIAQQTIEVRRNGSTNYVLKMNLAGLQYRTYIYSNLYGL